MIFSASLGYSNFNPTPHPCVRARTHAPCVHGPITPQPATEWQSWRKRTAIFWTILIVLWHPSQTVSSVPCMRARTQGRTPLPPPPPPPYWTKITLGLTCDDFTLSIGPLEANIYVFSGGLSENDWKSENERVHKFYSSGLIFAGTVNFFFPTWKVVPGAYSDRD